MYLFYIVKEYEDGECFEYTYGCIEHARNHATLMGNRCEIYGERRGVATLLETVNA